MTIAQDKSDGLQGELRKLNSEMTFVEFLKTDVGRLAVHPQIRLPLLGAGRDFASFDEVEQYRLDYVKGLYKLTPPAAEACQGLGRLNNWEKVKLNMENTWTAWEKYQTALRLIRLGELQSAT